MTPRAVEERLILCDADLHAYLTGSEVGETVMYLQELVLGLLCPAVRWSAAAVLDERARRCAAESWQAKVLEAFNTCPHNLAERFLEAAAIYRSIGSIALPELLPLALELLETDLHAYFALQTTPYRDHLPHQVRVAALAHLLISEKMPLPRWNLFLSDKIARWHSSRECVLLLEHLARNGLEAGFPQGEQERRGLCLVAALLAGLVHDIGYALKTAAGMGVPVERVLERFRVFPGPGHAWPDPPDAPVTALYRTFWKDTGPGGSCSTMRAYVAAHPDSPHSIAGAMWLAYLPQRMRSEGIYLEPDTDRLRRRWGRIEFVSQLAAMMTLAHDFPLESEKKQGEQGFCAPKLREGETLVDHYPYTASFALADLLHEFGRPYIYSGPEAVCVRAPVVGIDLVYPDEWHGWLHMDRHGATTWEVANLDRCYDERLLSTDQRNRVIGEGARIEIFWDVRDSQEPHFPTPPGATGAPPHARHSTFDEQKLGKEVLSRLEGWGFDRVFCQRDVNAAQEAERRGALTCRMVAGRGSLNLRPTPPPAGHTLAIYPLESYSDEYRRLRERLNPRPLL